MASYRLILDREVGNHKLHKQVAIVAAGNLDTDNAITNTMSSALISRFAHFDVTLNKDEWLKWASNSGIDYRITTFLSFKPTLLYTFNPDATSPYACPRTWQMVSNVINGTTITDEDIALLRSMVGEGVAHEFVTYNKLYTELPSFDDVMRDPKGIKISEHLGTQWALMSMVASNIDDKNASKVISFIERLSMELQICAMREVKGRKGKEWIIANALDWVSKTSKEIYRVE